MNRPQWAAIVRGLHRGASVADQLAFDRWSPESQAIARRAVALEIEGQAKPDPLANDKIEAARQEIAVFWEEMKAELPKALKGDERAIVRVEALTPELDRGLDRLTDAIDEEGAP